MKNYTVMPNNISKILHSADTYRYVALSFTPLKKGYTDATFKQIGTYINATNPESERTIENFVGRLKKSGLILITSYSLDGKRRNQYYMPQVEENFRTIRNEFLELDLPIELKGFMLQLFSICLNGTYTIMLSVSKICTLINISKPTAIKYMNTLLALELVTQIKGGYKLVEEYFEIGESKRVKEMEYVTEYVEDLPAENYYKMVYENTLWDKVEHPKAFWISVIAGYRGKQKQIKEASVKIKL